MTEYKVTPMWKITLIACAGAAVAIALWLTFCHFYLAPALAALAALG